MPAAADAEAFAGCVVTLHGFRGPAGSALDGWLRDSEGAVPGTCTVAGPYTAVVGDVTAPADVLASVRVGLPSGPAAPEAMAIRLRSGGAVVEWGEPVREVGLADWLASCAARGRHAVEVVRADPSLLPGAQIGSWWSASPAFRWLRALPGSPERWPARLLEQAPPGILSDLAFWAGVRAAADRQEWMRLARESYVVLCYHRVAGERKPGQERMDIDPVRFHRQLALLRALGWRPLPPRDMVEFHADPAVRLGRRRYVVTLDDAFLDAVVAARRAHRFAPQVFAVTDAVGGHAGWLGDEPLADWAALRDLCAAGGVVGSHARHHVRLDTLADDEVGNEVAGSLDDLRRHVDVDLPLIAYPHGANDERVRAAARAAGYAAAYSSMHGRNGAGADPFALRRVEPKEFESTAVFLWKVLTGANRPPAYRRLLRVVTRRARSATRVASRRRSGTRAARTR